MLNTVLGSQAPALAQAVLHLCFSFCQGGAITSPFRHCQENNQEHRWGTGNRSSRIRNPVTFKCPSFCLPSWGVWWSTSGLCFHMGALSSLIWGVSHQWHHKHILERKKGDRVEEGEKERRILSEWAVVKGIHGKMVSSCRMWLKQRNFEDHRLSTYNLPCWVHYQIKWEFVILLTWK